MILVRKHQSNGQWKRSNDSTDEVQTTDHKQTEVISLQAPPTALAPRKSLGTNGKANSSGPSTVNASAPLVANEITSR
jgi:hypothetical protein